VHDRPTSFDRSLQEEQNRLDASGTLIDFSTLDESTIDSIPRYTAGDINSRRIGYSTSVGDTLYCYWPISAFCKLAYLPCLGMPCPLLTAETEILAHSPFMFNCQQAGQLVIFSLMLIFAFSVLVTRVLQIRRAGFRLWSNHLGMAGCKLKKQLSCPELARNV
jgi:hypothetical protein